jgi:hypothetical protein
MTGQTAGIPCGQFTVRTLFVFYFKVYCLHVPGLSGQVGSDKVAMITFLVPDF